MPLSSVEKHFCKESHILYRISNFYQKQLLKGSFWLIFYFLFEEKLKFRLYALGERGLFLKCSFGAIYFLISNEGILISMNNVICKKLEFNQASPLLKQPVMLSNLYSQVIKNLKL